MHMASYPGGAMVWRVLVLLLVVAYTAAITGNSTRCFECVDLPLPLYCGRVTECSPGMKCVVEEVITSGGLTMYNTGCRSEERCRLGEGHTDARYRHLDRRSDKIICEECCDGEYCNHEGCGVTAKQQPERGALCFHCDYSHEPDQCRNIMECDIGSVCQLTELTRRRPDGGPLYRSSCTTPADCQVNEHVIIGKKRDTACHTCCKADFCNDKCLSHPATTVTTSTATPTSQVVSSTVSVFTQTTTRVTTDMLQSAICHQHNYTYDDHSGLCYRFHDRKDTWNDADEICRQEGGRLAVIDTQQKWQFLKPLVMSHYEHDYVYIGGKDDGHDHYRWVTGTRLKDTFEAWSGDQPDRGDEECAYISHKYHWEWHDTICDNEFKFICTIQ